MSFSVAVTMPLNDPSSVLCPTCFASPGAPCCDNYLGSEISEDVCIARDTFHPRRIEQAAMLAAIRNGGSTSTPTVEAFDQAVDQTGLI